MQGQAARERRVQPRHLALHVKSNPHVKLRSLPPSPRIFTSSLRDHTKQRIRFAISSTHREMSSSMAPEAGEPSSSTAAAPRIKSRPARRQILPHELTAIKQAADKSGQNGLTYNIWYGKWAGGDREDDFVDKTKASHRVDIARDSGYTRGDAQGAAFICLFFARGYCPNG